MSTTSTHGDRYVLGHSREEYERVRGQARMWNRATARLLDELGLRPGARCADAGCGPGETMRLMAERVGPGGSVLGLDVDAAMVATTRSVLHDEGLAQCDARVHDLTDEAPLPGGPFDLVYGRFILFHLPARVAVLRRLWDAVAPGGYLLVQDYDLDAVSGYPRLPSADTVMELMKAAMTAAGCDVQAGPHLPGLFRDAGIGAPDGTDVAGRLDTLTEGRAIMDATLRSVLPAAVAYGTATEQEVHAALDRLARDQAAEPKHPVLMPLLMGAWKRRPAAAAS